MDSRWGTAHRRYTELRIHPSAWPAGYSTMMRVVWSSSHVGSHETMDWLTNTAISSARLYWENKLLFFGVKNILHPGSRERFS
jgi:hypothetical protein